MRVTSYRTLLSLRDASTYNNITALELDNLFDFNEGGKRTRVPKPILLQPLPPNLTELYISGPLTVLPSLPPRLRTLVVDNNLLTSLPTLPVELEVLCCNDNLLTVLPTLPKSLRELLCLNNQLTSLPSLPESLQILDCSNNLLTELPSLPVALCWLDVSDNKLRDLPALPAGLEVLFATNTLLGMPLDWLPSGLLECDISNKSEGFKYQLGSGISPDWT